MFEVQNCQIGDEFMNKAGKERAEQLAQKEYSLIDYRNKLVRMQNMDCLCHCSAEIDMGTLLYFSVNDLYLGQGYYVMMLFSEVSDNSPEQQEGRDVFGRMFTYAIVEEVAKEVLTGHYSFYSSELDGRLVFILSFPYGLLPDRSIVDFLDENCRQIAQRCRSRYDMKLVTYIGEPIDNIHFVSAVYTKLLETATLHRYTGRHFDDSVFRVTLPTPEQWSTRLPSVMDSARELLSRIFRNEDYHGRAAELLESMADDLAGDVDMLKRMFGEFLECIFFCAREMGVKLPEEELRDQQFRLLLDSVRWDEPCCWLHKVLDEIHREYEETAKKAVRQQFDTALQYIEDHLSDPSLTIESCAAAAGCSSSALSKLFRRQINSSAAKHIRHKRLELALSLLQQGCSVGDCCRKCGFGSTETFHRAFKEKYGVTPGQVRGLGLPEA